MATFLLLGLAAAAVPVFAQYQQPCREIRHGLDSGQVKMPDFGPPPHFNVTCVWTRPAQDDRRLLIRVDGVHLPPDELRESSLKLVLDDEVIEIPRNCVRCLKQNFVSTGGAKVLYKSVLLEDLAADESPSDAATRDLGSFQVRYKSFHPTRCDSPKQPLNGFASVSSRDLGQEVVYGCKPPYEVLGPDTARCGVKDDLDSPVPEWTVGPPKCVVTNCSSTVYRTVGNGALASPGYPLYVVPSTVDCRWILQAERGSRLQIDVTFLQLSGKSGSFGSLSLSDKTGRQLYLYNETSNETISLVVNSSEVVVNFVTTNTQPVKGGFYLAYQLLRDICPDPDKPENGQVLFDEPRVGSTATYRCLPEHNLSGDAKAVCQSNGTWSGVLPRCVPHLDFKVHDLTGDGSSVASSPATTVASVQHASVTQSVELPKVTKPSKKSKVRPTEKPTEKTSAKPKSHEAPTPFQANASDTPTTSEADDQVPSKETKTYGKDPSSLNNAQEKVTKPRNKDNSTSVKQKQLPEPSSGVAHRAPDSPGLVPYPHLDKEEKNKNLDVFEEEEEEEEEEAREEEVLGMKSYIIIGVASTLLVVVIGLVVALVVYRRRFPVRLAFGRKFSTFENPVYVSKDAQHTRELKRLTI